MTRENTITVTNFSRELKRIYRKNHKRIKYAKPVRREDKHVPTWWDAETRERLLV